MRTRSTRAVIALVSLVMITSCTTTSQGDPTPTSTNDSTRSSSTPPSENEGGLPSDGAPKVTTPLDTTSFQQDPCQTITATQAQELNLPASGETEEAPLGSACGWFNSETRGEVTVSFFNKNPRGLSAIYKANSEGKYAFFSELPSIDEYPAVEYDIVDDRKNGGCAVIVGVADDLAFETDLQLSTSNVGQKDPCETAAQVAEMALETMQGGS